MKRGFTIIEIAVVILISAIISITLYQLFRQTINSVRGVNAMIDQDQPVMPLYNQLERDITGMFAPRASIAGFLEEINKKKQNDRQSKKQSEGKVPGSSDKNAADKPDEQKPKKFLKNIFSIQSKQAGSLVLSFITTNGIQLLESDGSIKPQPSFFRVAYVIEPDPERPGTSTLSYRCSALNRELNEILGVSGAPGYLLLSGLRTMTVECTVFEPSKDEHTTEQKADQKKSVSFKEWNEAEIVEKYKTLIPAFVRLTGTYTDFDGKREYTFEYYFRVYSYHEYSDKPIRARERLQSTPDASKNILEKIDTFMQKAVTQPMLAMGKKPPMLGASRR